MSKKHYILFKETKTEENKKNRFDAPSVLGVAVNSLGDRPILLMIDLQLLNINISQCTMLHTFADLYGYYPYRELTPTHPHQFLKET